MENDFRLEVSQFSKELQVLFMFLKGEVGGDVLSALPTKWLADLDWSKFLQLVMHHRVYPDLYRKLQQIKDTKIPEYVIAYLRKQYHQNAFQMLQLSAEMEQLSRLFITHSIRSLVLKGPVLAADLYGDLSLRTSRDLDILVPFEALDRVEQLLSKQNYDKIEYPSTVLNDWKWRHHHITYYHAEKRVTVEIHWRLGPGPAKEPNFNELWDRKRISTITSSPIYYLGRGFIFISHLARGSSWLVTASLVS